MNKSIKRGGWIEKSLLLTKKEWEGKPYWIIQTWHKKTKLYKFDLEFAKFDFDRIIFKLLNIIKMFVSWYCSFQKKIIGFWIITWQFVVLLAGFRLHGSHFCDFGFRVWNLGFLCHDLSYFLFHFDLIIFSFSV